MTTNNPAKQEIYGFCLLCNGNSLKSVIQLSRSSMFKCVKRERMNGGLHLAPSINYRLNFGQ